MNELTILFVELLRRSARVQRRLWNAGIVTHLF